MFSRLELKDKAKNAFRRNYWSCVLICFICSLLGGIFTVTFSNDSSKSVLASIAGGEQIDPAIWGMFTTVLIISSIISALVGIFIRNPLTVSVARFYYANRETNAKLDEAKYPFGRSRYLTVVGALFVKQLLIGLFTLLLIVPGIIKMYDYYMVEYILADYPDLTINEALDRSKKMMRGHRLDTFVLNLSFLPWLILSLFTFGILNTFYLNPYITATNAELYFALKCVAFPDDIDVKNEDEVTDSDAHETDATESDNPFDFNSDSKENGEETTDSTDSTGSTDGSSDLFD